MDYKEFGHLLCKCRKNSGLTQKQLARAVDIADSEISRFEKGWKKPIHPLLHKIINQLHPKNSEDDLNRLWELAGYEGLPSSWQDSRPTHPHILLLNQLIEDLYKRKVDSRIIDKIMDEVLITTQSHLGILSSNTVLAQRDWRKALEILNEVSRRLNRLEDLYAELHIARARAHYGDGNYQETIKESNLALRSLYKVETSLDIPEQIIQLQLRISQTLIGLGDVYRRLSQYDVAEGHYKNAQQILSSIQTRSGKKILVDSLRKQAGIMNYLGNAREAIRLLDESTAVREELDEDELDYKFLQHIAWSYRILGRWDEAIVYGQRALALALEHGDVWDIMKAHIYLGDSYRLLRNLKKAEEHYLEALRSYESIQDGGRHARLQVGMIYLGLGRVYIKDPAQYQLAEKYLHQSLQVHYDLGEEFWIANVQNELGELHLAYGEYEQAHDYMIQSANTLKRLNTKFSYLSALVSLCKYYYQRNMFTKIDETMNEARGIDDQQMDTHLARISLIAGKAKLKQDLGGEAETLICKALQYAIQFNNYVFSDIRNEIFLEIDSFKRNKNMDNAQTLIRICQHCISEKEWNSEHSRLVEEFEQKLALKFIEISSLTA